MADRVIQRNDTAARWQSINPVLATGEIGIEIDGAKGYKIGDGKTRWNDLPYPANPTNVVQELGNNENAVPSQKLVTEKLSELGSEVGHSQELEYSFSSDYQYYKLQKPIYAGQEVYIEGVDDLNFYNDISGTNYRIKGKGIAPVDFNYIRCLTTYGTAKVRVKGTPYQNAMRDYCIKSLSENIYFQQGCSVTDESSSEPIINRYFYIRDSKETKITLSKRLKGYQMLVEFYNESFESVSNEITIRVGDTIDVPIDCKYMQFRDYTAEVIAGGTMVNYGGEVLDYEPFVFAENVDSYKFLSNKISSDIQLSNKKDCVFKTISATKNVFPTYNKEEVSGLDVTTIIETPCYIIRDQKQTKLTMSQRLKGYQLGVWFYDESFNVIGERVWMKVSANVIDIPTNCYYFKFSDYVAEILQGGTMVNYGEEILDYEPFVPSDGMDVYNIAKEGKEKADTAYDNLYMPFSVSFTFTKAYETFKLPYTIRRGQRVFINGDITKLNFYNNLEEISNGVPGFNQPINNGEISLETATYVRCESIIGSCTITVTDEIMNPVKPVKNLLSNYCGNIEGLNDTDLVKVPMLIERDITQSKITMSKRTKGYKLRIVFLDANYNKIQTASDISFVSGATVEIPSNCRYFYFFDYVAELKEGTSMVNYGEATLDYEPFAISETFGISEMVKSLDERLGAAESCIAEQRKHFNTIIKENICLSSTKENLLYVNDVIIKDEDEYRMAMQNNHYTLVGGIAYAKKPSIGEKTGYLYASSQDKVQSPVQVKTTSYAPPSRATINMLDIGSSYVDLQRITERQKQNYEADGFNVNLIGTMGNDGSKHEARSGGTWDFLLKPLGRAVIIDVSGVSSLPITGYPGTTYMDSNGVKWTVRGVMVSNGSGKIVLSSFSVDTNYDGGTGSSSTNYDIAAENIPSVGVLTKTTNDSTGTSTTQGDDTISYTSKELVYYNPFWNPTTNQLDFAYYINKWGFNAPDVISLTFGSNDLGNFVMQSDSTVSSVTDKALQVVTRIHEQYPNCKILLTTSCYGYGGNSAKENQVPIRKHNLQKYYLSLVEKMGNNTEYASYVAIVPTLCMVDRMKGFNTYKIKPCSLYEDEIEMSGDMVHPNYLGFYQFADAMLGYAYKLME